jgi:hypothetical protein
MQLPNPIQKRLAEEFRFAADQMKTVSDVQSKLWFFSAFYGETTRILNVWWNPELALLHMVLQDAFRIISTNAVEYAASGGRAIGFPAKELPETLTAIALDIAELFQQKKVDEMRLHNILTRLAELAYATTGNGRYLVVKKTINLSPPNAS